MATTSPAPETRNDLLDLFRWSLGRGPFHASDAARLRRSWNVRYARELLGLLVQEGLLIETTDADGADAVEACYWDTQDLARGAFEGSFGQAAGRPVSPEVPRRPVKAARQRPVSLPGGKQLRECGCGCGQRTSGGTYLPGHDAKHVSKTVAAMVDATNPKVREGLVAALPTEALRAKARASFARRAVTPARGQ